MKVYGGFTKFSVHCYYQHWILDESGTGFLRDGPREDLGEVSWDYDLFTPGDDFLMDKGGANFPTPGESFYVNVPGKTNEATIEWYFEWMYLGDCGYDVMRAKSNTITLSRRRWK